MVIAGPVFTEWHWGPIFFLVVFGPPIAGLTAALYLAARRRVRRGRRPLLLAGCLALAVGLVLLGGEVWRAVKFEREARADARAIDFPTFLPRGYDAERVRPVVASGLIALSAAYDGPLYLQEQRAGPFDGSDPANCEVYVDGPLATFPEELGPCRPGSSPGGLAVLRVDDTPLAATYAVRDGTLVQVRHPPAAADGALALIDALEPVAPADIDFKR